jgi:hypothetical protein
MRRKIADESVRFRRCTECGSVGPLVDGREHIVDHWEHLEHLRMRGIKRHGDCQRRVALGRRRLPRIGFENRPDVEGAMKKGDTRVAADAVSWRMLAPRLRLSDFGAGADLRNCKFAGRYIA